MAEVRTVEVKRAVLAANDEKADAFRAARCEEGCFFTDVMASSGAGKTTLRRRRSQHGQSTVMVPDVTPTNRGGDRGRE